MIKIGDKVKDFSLLDGDGKTHKLSDYLGKKVIIYFYPKNQTPGCTAQACSFRDHSDLYSKNNVVVLGISKDSVKSHANFKKKQHLSFPTLSDEKMEVIKYFGAYGEKKMFGKSYLGVLRNTYIIDEKGFLTHIMPNVNAKDNASEVLEIINSSNA